MVDVSDPLIVLVLLLTHGFFRITLVASHIPGDLSV